MKRAEKDEDEAKCGFQQDQKIQINQLVMQAVRASLISVPLLILGLKEFEKEKRDITTNKCPSHQTGRSSFNSIRLLFVSPWDFDASSRP